MNSYQPQPGILALLPAHNEASRVGTVVQALRVQGYPVLVVDDGSEDGTAAEARAAGAQVLVLSPNRGKGAALKAGFREALFGDGQPQWAAFLTLDADGQHDPADVPTLISAWRSSGADLVIGARDYRAMPPIRRCTNALSRWVLSLALGTTIADNQSGFRLHSRRLASAVLGSPEEGFAFEVDEIAVCIGRGYKLVSVPVRTIYAGETSDIRAWTHFTSFLRVAWRSYRRVRAEAKAERERGRRTDGIRGAD